MVDHSQGWRCSGFGGIDGRRSLTQKKGKLEPMSPEPEVAPMTHNQPKTDTD
jgi:hypothetical protein